MAKSTKSKPEVKATVEAVTETPATSTGQTETPAAPDALLPGENPEATTEEVAPVVEPPPAEQPVAAPKDGSQPVQRQEVVHTPTKVIHETPPVMNAEPPIQKELRERPDGPIDVSKWNPGTTVPRPAPQPVVTADPYPDLRTAIISSLNPKTFFPITPLLRRHFGPRFNTQEAAKEVRVLLSNLHDTRQVIVNHARHMQLGRPHYPGADMKTQYWTLDKVALECMLASGVVK